mgnify:FL=1
MGDFIGAGSGFGAYVFPVLRVFKIGFQGGNGARQDFVLALFHFLQRGDDLLALLWSEFLGGSKQAVEDRIRKILHGGHDGDKG